MKALTPLQKQDYQRFYLEIPEVGFSSAKNKAVVENSIKKFEAKLKKEKDLFSEYVSERTDAVVTYLKAIDRGGVSSRLDHFFTSNQIKYLNGYNVRQKIMEGLRIIRNKNRLKYATKKW